MGLLRKGKGLSRRAKKTIRRSISGVCMATAIIVALVPAEVSRGYSTIPAEAVANDDYSYGVKDDGTDDTDLEIEGNSFKLDRYDFSTETTDDDRPTYKTKYVRQSSDGSFEYGWQFVIYQDNYKGVNYGIICDYNSSYQANTLEIAKSLPYEYTTVTKDEFNVFFAHYQETYNNYVEDSSNGTTFTIAGHANPYKARFTMKKPANSVLTDSDEYYLKKYFNDEYLLHVELYRQWEAAKAAYEQYLHNVELYEGGQLQQQPTPVDPPDEEPELTKWVKDIKNDDNTDSLRRVFFCEVNQAYNTKVKGYTLVEVKDYVNPATGIETPKIYLAQGVPNPNNDASIPNDKFGFHVEASTDIIAIGNQAFKGTTNVYDLQLSDDLAFVGDEAFKDSFVRSIAFSNVKNIGNRAFKSCTQLTNITFDNGTTIIGTEAFYGSGLRKVSFPYSIKEIGPGAFANCAYLAEIDLSQVAQDGASIDGFAFYDDVALNKIQFSDTIATIGDAAFACVKGETGTLTIFQFPDNVTTIGDFVVAGRANLSKVIMPRNLGKSASPVVTLKENIFRNCFNMECLEFPDDCGYLDFKDCDNIFTSITKKTFYVKGPENNSAKTPASPRKSTWGKKNGLGEMVPYVYIDENGKTLYEISDETYILVIDGEGVLQSCKFVPDPDVVVGPFDMVVPSKVGQTAVTGIATECFSDLDVKNNMESLVIEDDTISEIADSAFKNFKNLKYVELGNTVTNIGASAFEGCDKLTHVKFHTPKNGYSSFPIDNLGTNAFATGASSLVFEGDIDSAYGPFQWAMDVNNFVDADEGIRVCYYTGAPDYLTVIVDNKNGYPTLINYPHYDELNEHSGTENDTHPLTERYEHLGEEITENGELYIYSTTAYEDKLIDKTLNIKVPDGIKSIDVKGYMTNTSLADPDYSSNLSNTKNVATYFANASSPVFCKYYNTYRDYGLFNGYYGNENDNEGKKKEYSSVTEPDRTNALKYETDSRGNDRIDSIDLNSVVYLPEYAFYSCEKLSKMSLGADLETMGPAPFTGCNNLTSVGGTTDDFTCTNGIVYSVNEDGSYNIVEVLSSRGLSVGSQKIKVSDEDPNLAKVSTISDGAFENCDYITGVNFQDVTKLKEIPDTCFMDCNKLNQIILPENITEVGHKAFANTMEGIEVVFYGEEVYIPHDAFDGLSSFRVISYEDSAVRKAAKDLGADVSEVLDDTVKVQFFDYDGRELSPIIFVVEGGDVSLSDIPENPEREGYKFIGWNKALTNINSDTVVVATYERIPGTVDPDDPGTSTSDPGNGNSTSNPTSNSNSTSNTQLYTLTVTNGNGSGSYAAGATVIITCTNPPAGQVFDKWVPGSDDLGIASVNVAATTLVMPAHEATVQATFKNAPTNTSNGGTNNSGSNSTRTTTSTGNNNNGSSVIISKNGISNKELASATVSGSTDNYIIRIAETTAATAAVEKALTNEYGSLDNVRYSAMDITLYDATGQNQITDYSGLSIAITMPLPDVMTKYAGNNKVAGVVNEKLDKLSPKFTTIDGVSCITFTATHFSPYTIYVNVENMGESVTDDSPKTADGIHPKWFLVFGLAALSIGLFFMKDKQSVKNLNLG